MHNLINRRFDKLLVLRQGEYVGKNNKHTQWVCLCDCGKEKSVRTTNLLKGMTKSCGCLKSPDLTGLKYGRLLVLKKAITRPVSKAGKIRTDYSWDCVCDCGKLSSVQSSHLRSGGTKSCGCLQREMLPTTKYYHGVHFLIKEYRRGAAERKIEWNLSDAEVEVITSRNCYYCTKPPSKALTPPDRKVLVTFYFNGIDRLDSSKGYESDNVVTCCTMCNYSKRNYSHDDFIAMARAVAKNHLEKEAGAGNGLLSLGI